jgi:hypothetical protein
MLLSVQAATAVVIMAAAGCSTSPVADFLDFCRPGRFPDKAKDAHGGVCLPQGGPAGGMLGAPPPIAPPIAPGAGPLVPSDPAPAPITSTPLPGQPK